MSADFVIPLIASLVWLLIVGSALASYRLGWGQIIKMALIWIAIFLGLFLVVEWFVITRDAASSLL